MCLKSFSIRCSCLLILKSKWTNGWRDWSHWGRKNWRAKSSNEKWTSACTGTWTLKRIVIEWKKNSLQTNSCYMYPVHQKFNHQQSCFPEDLELCWIWKLYNKVLWWFEDNWYMYYKNCVSVVSVCNTCKP